MGIQLKQWLDFGDLPFKMVAQVTSRCGSRVIGALDFALQQFTGQSARHGLLVVEVGREQSQTSWQRFSSEERLYCRNTWI